MTTPRLIMLPDTAAALDRLNDARATFTKMDIEYTRHGDSIDYRQMLPTFRTQAAAFTSELLRGAVYTDAEPDPRVAALEADLAAVVAYARSLEDALIPTLPHDAIEPDGYVVHAGTDDEVRQDLRAEAGVQRIMEEASDGE